MANKNKFYYVATMPNTMVETKVKGNILAETNIKGKIYESVNSGEQFNADEFKLISSHHTFIELDVQDILNYLNVKHRLTFANISEFNFFARLVNRVYNKGVNPWTGIFGLMKTENSNFTKTTINTNSYLIVHNDNENNLSFQQWFDALIDYCKYTSIVIDFPTNKDRPTILESIYMGYVEIIDFKTLKLLRRILNFYNKQDDVVLLENIVEVDFQLEEKYFINFNEAEIKTTYTKDYVHVNIAGYFKNAGITEENIYTALQYDLKCFREKAQNLAKRIELDSKELTNLLKLL